MKTLPPPCCNTNLNSRQTTGADMVPFEALVAGIRQNCNYDTVVGCACLQWPAREMIHGRLFGPSRNKRERLQNLAGPASPVPRLLARQGHKAHLTPILLGTSSNATLADSGITAGDLVERHYLHLPRQATLWFCDTQHRLSSRQGISTTDPTLEPHSDVDGARWQICLRPWRWSAAMSTRTGSFRALRTMRKTGVSRSQPQLPEQRNKETFQQKGRLCSRHSQLC